MIVIGGPRADLVWIDQVIFQFQNEQVAGFEAQIGRLDTVAVDVAIASRAVLFFLVSYREVDSEDAVLAAQVFGFGNSAANRRARASFLRRFLRMQTAMSGRADNYQENCEQRFLHFIA